MMQGCLLGTRLGGPVPRSRVPGRGKRRRLGAGRREVRVRELGGGGSRLPQRPRVKACLLRPASAGRRVLRRAGYRLRARSLAGGGVVARHPSGLGALGLVARNCARLPVLGRGEPGRRGQPRVRYGLVMLGRVRPRVRWHPETGSSLDGLGWTRLRVPGLGRQFRAGAGLAVRSRVGQRGRVLPAGVLSVLSAAGAC
jgi:hypothetical protein